MGNIFLVITILGGQYWSNVGGVWHVRRQLVRSTNMIHILRSSVHPRNYLRPENGKILKKNCIEKILKGIVQVESTHWQGDGTKFDLFVMPTLNCDFQFRLQLQYLVDTPNKTKNYWQKHYLLSKLLQQLSFFVPTWSFFCTINFPKYD